LIKEVMERYNENDWDGKVAIESSIDG